MMIRTIQKTATHALARLVMGASLLTLTTLTAASGQTKDPRAIVKSASDTELESDRTDHSAYIYRDHDITPDHDTLYLVAETKNGNLRRKLEDHGKPLNATDEAAEEARIQTLLKDTAQQAKLKKDSSKDDQDSEELLKILPDAFIWTLTSEVGDLITLDFKPNSAYDPPNMEARVFAAMAGQIVVAKGDNRIRTIKGTLVDDVKFVGGLAGRLHKNGTFQVERREVAPHHWQVTELHVHLQGKVFFKSIGSQEDEWKTDFRPSSLDNMQQAWDFMNSPKEKSRAPGK